jgi:hypothetical protein
MVDVYNETENSNTQFSALAMEMMEKPRLLAVR